MAAVGQKRTFVISKSTDRVPRGIEQNSKLIEI
jgi:hypothetical protein